MTRMGALGWNQVVPQVRVHCAGSRRLWLGGGARSKVGTVREGRAEAL